MTIQIYTEGYTAESQGNTINLHLKGVDPAQILAELDKEDIISYVMQNLASEYTDAVVEAGKE